MPTLSRASGALSLLAIACGGGAGPAATTNTRPPTDSRTTAELASSDGTLRVHFLLEGMVAPASPLLLSIDDREPDAITFPIEEKVYALDPGHHSIKVQLDQAGCSVNRSLDNDAPSNPLDRVLTLPDVVVNYIVMVDCTSILNTWYFKITAMTERREEDGFHLTMSSDQFGTREYQFPSEGSVALGPTHVGWYHLRLDGVAAGCRVHGLGAPGWPTDSIQIQPHSGLIFYWVYCE